MTLLVQQAAVLCVATGVLTGVAVAVRTGDLRQGLSMLLDFVLAAGALRLSASASWSTVLTAGAIVLVRGLLLHVGPRVTGPPPQTPPRTVTSPQERTARTRPPGPS